MFPIHTFPISRGAQVGERELSDGSSMTGLVPASESKSEMRRDMERPLNISEHMVHPHILNTDLPMVGVPYVKPWGRSLEYPCW